MEPSQHRLADRLVGNVLSNVLRSIVSFPLALVVTPIIVAKLGTTAFGVWALVRAFTSYVSLLDLGMGSALAKLVAQYRGSGRNSDINDLLNTTLVIYVCMGAVASLGVFAVRGWVATTFFKGASGYGGEISFLLMGVVIILAANLALGVFASLLIGAQRMDLTNLSGTVGVLFYHVASLAFVLLGWGLRGLLVVSACSTLLTATINILLARTEYPGLRITPMRFRSTMVRMLLGLGLQYQVGSLAVLVHAHLDKLILGHFLGVNFVAYYEIAGRLIERLRSFPVMLLSPILPAASELDAREDRLTLERLYRQALRYVGAVSFPVFILFAALAYPIVHMWIGYGYERAALALQVLALANLVNILTGPASYILAGVGKPRYQLYSSLLGIILNITLSPLLVWCLGFTGAILGTSAALAIASLFFIVLFHRVERVPIAKSITSIRFSGVSAAALGAATWHFAYKSYSWVGLLTAAAIFGLLYVGSLFVLPWLEPDDRELVRRYAGRYLRWRVM